MDILLVDDSPPVREPLELQLNILGHEIKCAGDGLEALDACRGQTFDLVITDIRMPRMDGLQLLRQLHKEFPELDVIIITGYGDMDSSLEALRHGACNYLMKPVSMEEVSLAVRTVEKRKAMAALIKEQEARLIEARKMADLGIVAAGVAHEINNPTTFIRGNIQTLQKIWEVLGPFIDEAIGTGVEPPARIGFIIEEFPKILEAMMHGTERIHRIVEATAAFTTREANVNFKGVDLNDCVRRAVDKLAGSENGLLPSVSLDEALPRVRGTAEDLTEIVIELVINSTRAVSSKPNPRVEITTSPVESGAVMLVVEDNGAGIREEDRPRVFTPFFTTEPRIGRPGLGLSKVYALVRGFGGETSFASREGQGTRFQVILPILNEDKDHATADR